MIAAPSSPTKAKELGAFYTSTEVASFLVQWAMRSHTDVVLDPSAGGGVFLRAAIERVTTLGGDISQAVQGVEVDAETHRAVCEALAPHGLPRTNLTLGDFFSAGLDFAGRVDCVVGNPPFIRYQQFNGPARGHAASCMARLGVSTSDLASSWAPFVLCSAALLRRGGRLAMVVPMEMGHASYALPVLSFLSQSFRSVQFLSFDQRLFPHLSQDTMLLLADDRGEHRAEMRWKHLRDSSSLAELHGVGYRMPRARRLDGDAIASGRQRLIEQFLPAKARTLYALLRRHERVQPLGTLADVGIGYVTGANDFFHLSEQDVSQWEIPPAYLRPAVCRGRALSGLRFTRDDWQGARRDGSAAYLLLIPAGVTLPASVRAYIEHGLSAGVHKTYKCATRSPWYVVPHVYEPQAFLTYMSGITPRLVANDAGAVAPNTLHVVRALPLTGMPAARLAVAWQSSLSELSAEVEGHAMGGGMLKLEPREAARVLVSTADAPEAACVALDRLARHAAPGTVRTTVDRMVLQDGLGLTEAECRCLREAAHVLRARRLGRGA